MPFYAGARETRWIQGVQESATDSTHTNIVYIEKGACLFVFVLAVGGGKRKGEGKRDGDELYCGRVMDGAL